MGNVLLVEEKARRSALWTGGQKEWKPRTLGPMTAMGEVERLPGLGVDHSGLS